MKRIAEAIVIAVARGCSHCRCQYSVKLPNGLPHTKQSIEERMIVCIKVSAVYHLGGIVFLTCEVLTVGGSVGWRSS
jgi:hypothetical protein